MKKNHEFDILVIGSGIAGLNFALRAAEQKKRVLVITKKKVAEAGTNYAQGGIAAVLSQIDNYKKHVKDTLAAGSFHNDKKAVEFMVKHGPAAIYRLIELGVPFATQNGELMLTREGGHSERRIAFVSDYTGQAIEKTLVTNVKKNKFITLWENTFASDLIVKNQKCLGVYAIKNDAYHTILAQNTIIATGGVGQLFENTTNPAISTGDGLAMAYRAGCNFRDMEFIQFHPTALSIKGRPRFLISEAVRGEGALLLNSKRQRFMHKYHKLAELAPRDIVSQAIFEEEKNGQVYLDIRSKTRTYLKTRFPKIYDTLKKYGIDMARDLVPISPAAHYLCGGIKVNLKGETGIKNLYAFGEVSGTGVHGANRLASNSLLEALVFSERILDFLKSPQYSKSSGELPFPKFIKSMSLERRAVTNLRKSLKRIMWNYVGIVRTSDELKKAQKILEEIKQEVGGLKSNDQYTKEIINMVTVGLLITKAALKRKESLGCHFRKD